MHTTGAFTPEKKRFYDDLIHGTVERAYFSDIREASSKYFISSRIRDYVKELLSRNKKPLTMALSDSKILV